MAGRIKVAPAADRTMDNIVFHSKREMMRYSELKMLLNCRIISELKLQVKFPIVVNGTHVCNYISDFTYRDKDQKLIVEDAKGFRTEMFKLHAKLFSACYPHLRIVEV